MEVIDIGELYGPNPPGLARIYVLFADQVTATEPLAIAEGATAYMLFSPDLDAKYDYSLKPAEAFDISLSIDYPGDSATLYFISKHYAKRQFILIAQLLSGEYMQLGTLDFPLNCKMSGTNTLRVEFSGKQPQAPMAIDWPEGLAIEDQARKLGSNPKGIGYINILLADEVLSIPDPDEDGVISENLEVLDTTEVMQLYMADFDTQYDKTIEVDENGLVYEHKISVKVPHGYSIGWLRNRQVILIVQDLWTDQYIIGTMAMPMTVEVKYATGGNSGSRMHTLSFSGKTSHPAYKFTGPLSPVEPPPPPPPPPEMVDFDPNDFSNEDFY